MNKVNSRIGNIEAKKLLNELGISKANDLSIEDIALALGAFVVTDKLDGCDGRIIFHNNEAIITITDKVDYEPRRNFILCHEIGHFRLHSDLKPAFLDDEKSLSEWYAKGIDELQANSFASELLMPEELFKKLISGRRFNMQLVHEICDEFQTSQTASLMRYRILGEYPMALILVNNGYVEWKYFSDDFPIQYLESGTKVSPNTVVGDHFFNKNDLEESPEIVEAIEWFYNDYNIEQYKNWKFYEQGTYVAKNKVLVALWTY